MFKKLNLILSTVRYLKPVQIKYQLLYRLRKQKKLSRYKMDYDKAGLVFPEFNNHPPVYRSYLGANNFIFLNISHDFHEQINWNYQEHGKLWNYNLQYGNYLLQSDISPGEKLRLIRSLYEALASERITLEPYPVSLRVINIIRFFSGERINDEEILRYLHAEIDFLSQRPEYHLLGNHLLENAFALMVGGVFFSESKWISQGEKILMEELDEQILSDGAHFELSPMYHQIILFRVLELIDWYDNYEFKNADFGKRLEVKAALMCSWLEKMTFYNGKIPHFNDSAEGIAYSTSWLLDYAKKLNITWSDTPFGESGYRSVNKGKYECRIDFAQVGASYQPGHAHADALSFILCHTGKPVFIEVGTSTYQPDQRRHVERSTLAHNTVVVNEQNQSQVWGGFRVAKRGKTQILKDSELEKAASHDGYKSLGVNHSRRFVFDENSISIYDEITGNPKLNKEFYLHLAPGLPVQVNENIVNVGLDTVIKFHGSCNINVVDYDLAEGYNKYIKSKKIIVSFVDSLSSHFSFKSEH